MWRLSWCRGGSVLLTWSAIWAKLPDCAFGCMGRVFNLVERLSAWASSSGCAFYDSSVHKRKKMKGSVEVEGIVSALTRNEEFTTNAQQAPPKIC
ncbi:hypothetical protein CR513_46437, partial [Mucuna pruriens]